MSIRGLFSTSVNSLEKGINGLVKAGSIVGNAMDWTVRQSDKWNSEDTVLAEEIEYQSVIKERLARSLNMESYSDEELAEEVVKSVSSYKDMMSKIKSQIK